MANDTELDLEAEEAQGRIIRMLFDLGLVPPADFVAPNDEGDVRQIGEITGDDPALSAYSKLGEVEIPSLPRARQPENVILALTNALRAGGIPHRILAAAADSSADEAMPTGVALVQLDLKFFDDIEDPGLVTVSFRTESGIARFVIIQPANEAAPERYTLHASGNRFTASLSRDTIVNWLDHGGTMLLCM